jgi:heat shock protein HslJ
MLRIHANPRLAALCLALTCAAQANAQNGPLRNGEDLAGSTWRAVELYGRPVPSPWPNPSREPHLVFDTGGQLAGSDGCNLLRGPFTQKGEGLTFGALAGTQMACPGVDEETSRRFRNALTGTSHWNLVNGRLQLYGATGKPLAVLARRGVAPAAGAPLTGTTWQLVRFQGGDDRILTPSDRSHYTLAFEDGGRVAARVDCNRGRATWKAGASGQVEMGPLLLTRAKCPDGSLHDQIVKQWPAIRSFVLKDGHLFLSLMADGGVYEFEPAPSRK